jgi:hypothetical protein
MSIFDFEAWRAISTLLSILNCGMIVKTLFYGGLFMEDQIENNVKKSSKNGSVDSTEKGQPAIVIRHGAVAASIWRRQSPSGYAYYDFSLSRSWKSLSTSKAGYSQNFFARNHDMLVKCVQEAIAWIQEHQTEGEESQALDTLAA